MELETQLLENVNNQYVTAVENWYKDIKAYEAAISLTTDASEESINALRVVNYLLYSMLDEHDIEELTWNGTFVPDYDWLIINLQKINDAAYTLFDIDDYYQSVSQFGSFLKELSTKGIINNFTFVEDWLKFDLIGFDDHHMNRFNDSYTQLKDSILYFS